MAVNPLDVITITAKFVQAGQQLRNVFQVIHAGVSSFAESAVYSALSDWLDDAYSTLQPGLTDELAFTTIEAVNSTQKTVVGEAAWPTLTVGGAAVNEAEPLQIAALVRFPTNFQGAAGAKYIPGLTEGQLEPNGIISSGTLGGLATFGSDIVAGFQVSGEDFVPGADNPDKLRFAAFTSVVVNDVVSTQRRRKQGVGI